jgi:hypothetical protein
VSCVGSETETKCFELCDWFLFELSSDLLMHLLVTQCSRGAFTRGFENPLAPCLLSRNKASDINVLSPDNV